MRADMKRKNTQKAILLLVTLLMSQWAMSATTAALEVGSALFVRGAVSAQSQDGKAHLLEKQSPIKLHDRISTGTRSFAILEMNDGARITLRPDTVFVVDEYIWKAGKGKANYSLLKGGMRASTGLIGKNNPDASTIITPYATIYIRGTEYDARLCEKDCAEELRVLAEDKKHMSESLVIGRIEMIKGVVNAINIQGKERLVNKGGPVYLGDTLKTMDKSFVVVIFRDDSRLTLRPSSEVVLKDYLLSQEVAKDSRYVTELIKGGLRTLTGNIGKQNPEGFKVETASSSMGIRGTGFDVYYKNPTWVYVWSGAIDFEYGNGEILVGRCEGPSGGAPAIPSKGKCTVAQYDGSGVPRYLNDVPVFMRWPLGTRPDNKQFDGLHLGMFETQDHDYTKPGLYVSAYDGHIRVKDIDIGANEALFSNGKLTHRLKNIPPFQRNDPYPKPDELNERMLDLFDMFTGFAGAEQCEVQ